MKQEMLDYLGKHEWSIAPGGVLVCPCGHRVEDDGQCPNGHVSPMREAGMI